MTIDDRPLYQRDEYPESIPDDSCVWNYLDCEPFLSWDREMPLMTAEYMRTDPFGLCPVCRAADGYLNIKRDQWMVCHEHKKRWPLGDMFTSWKFENEEVWQKNFEKIKDYEAVRAYHYRPGDPTVPACEDEDTYPRSTEEAFFLTQFQKSESAKDIL